MISSCDVQDVVPTWILVGFYNLFVSLRASQKALTMCPTGALMILWMWPAGPPLSVLKLWRPRSRKLEHIEFQHYNKQFIRLRPKYRVFQNYSMDFRRSESRAKYYHDPRAVAVCWLDFRLVLFMGCWALRRFNVSRDLSIHGGHYCWVYIHSISSTSDWRTNLSRPD